MTILTEPPSKEPSLGSLILKTIQNDLLKRGLAAGGGILLIGIAVLLPRAFSGLSNSSDLVSRVDYERIQPGMTQTQVEATLAPGVEVSRSKESNRLVWENPDGSKIEAEFQNGILTNKAQSGLK